jgi:hypothetical protein
MRNRRWDKAGVENSANPSPLLPAPNAYDIKLTIDHENFTGYMGPLFKRNPQSPLHHARVLWRDAPPTPWVEDYDFQSRISFQFMKSHGTRRITVEFYDKDNKLLVSTKYTVYV